MPSSFSSPEYYYLKDIKPLSFVFRIAPGKITNLAVNGKGKVVGSRIHQSISWERPPDHKSPLTYTIKYTTADGMAHETTNDTVFNLTFMINDIHHVVHVAAVSDAGQGVYEVITIQYTGIYNILRVRTFIY